MKRSAVKLVQSMLNAAGANLREDGVWGRATSRAFSDADMNVQDAISDALERWENTSIRALQDESRRFTAAETSGGAALVTRKAPVMSKTLTSEVSIGKSNFISRDAAIRLAREYTSKAGLPVGTLEFMLDLEAPKVSGGFNPSGIGGAGSRYRGLYQFYDVERFAWADGQRWARTFGVQVPSMYPNGWADAASNTACAAGYAIMNSKILRDAGIRVTKETLYACHQQGAGAFKQMVRTRSFVVAGNQSGPGTTAVKTAFNQAVA